MFDKDQQMYLELDNNLTSQSHTNNFF